MTDPFADAAWERAQLRAELASRNFGDDGDILRGDVAWTDETGAMQQTAVTITFPDAFPYAPPVVRLDPDRPRDTDPVATFHVERTGELCLFGRDLEVHGAPWRDPDFLLDKVTGWVERTASGWPGDTDVDLERYLDNDGTLLTYDASTLPAKSGILRLEGRHLSWAPTDPAPARGNRRGKRRAGRRRVRVRRPAGFLLDAGEVTAPIRTWPELLAAASEHGLTLQRLLGDRALAVVLVRYSRNGGPGVLGLRVRPLPGGRRGVALAAAEVADVSTATRTMRAGTVPSARARARVAVVGCGAVGSYVADHLLRAGIGKMTLVDHELLRPGNLVRHLAGERHVGQFKVHAVHGVLAGTGLNVSGVTPRPALISTLREAADLARDHTVVVDATGDQRAAALLQDACVDVGANLVKVCLQRDGGIVRVDRFPITAGERHADTVEPLPGTLVFERGCSSPVSLTPPLAVATAAIRAATTILGVIDSSATPASLVEVLTPQPDAPYDALGPISAPAPASAAIPADRRASMEPVR